MKLSLEKRRGKKRNLEIKYLKKGTDWKRTIRKSFYFRNK